jgi:hypothetical protein
VTHVGIAIAQAIVRGVHSTLPLIRKALGEIDKEDERFLRALDTAAAAAKDWVRHKAVVMGQQNTADDSEQ